MQSLPPAVLILGALTSVLVPLGLRHAPGPSSPPPAEPPAQAAAREHDVMESAFCADCHPAIYAEHEQSTHGRAFTDPEVRLATARFDLNDCIICHTPRPIFETGVGLNPTRRYHDLEEGNTCMTCHWQPDYDYASFTGGMQCREAFHPDAGTVEACASCHRNHGTPYQWAKSPVAQNSGRECIDCHMEEVERPIAVGGPVRTVRRHVFPGARSEKQVRRAYRYEATVEGDHAVVTIENRGAGHNFPTELKQRSVESLVIVRDPEGNEVARSRKVFRDPYKRPYGLELPVNTQIPSGATREHRVPLPAAAGTVETTLFFKHYFPIEDYHPDLSRVLESRTIPFEGVTPSDEPVESAPDVRVVTPENISPELSSPANLVDYARPPIGTVEVEIPQGDSEEDIAALIRLFQFPVPEANRAAQARLVEIGLPAVPALIEALGSWDNKTYNQGMGVLQRIGRVARPALVAALEADSLYVRLHAREVVTRQRWRAADVEEPLSRALSAPHALDRASAARAIGVLQLADQKERLVPLLADADPDVVREAALALAEIDARDTTDAIGAALERAHYDETRRDLAYAAARLGSPVGMHVLLDGLDRGDDLIRESFFEAFFAVTGMHASYDPLAPRARRLDSIAALQAWWASEGGPEVLIPLDPDRDPLVEAEARKLIAALGGTGFENSTTEEDLGREEELLAMGTLAVPELVRGLKYPSGFAAKRMALCRTLGRIGDRRAAPALAAALSDPVVSTAAWAAWALEGLGDPATLPALRRYEQRLRTLRSNGTMPADAGHPDLLLAQVARARLAAGDESARNTLVSLLLSDNAASRHSAITYLTSRYGDDRGYDPDAPADARAAAAQRWMQ